MKKTYINPNMEVVKIQMHQHLLDASIPLSNTPASKDGDGNYDKALGRDFDFDDEDEY